MTFRRPRALQALATFGSVVALVVALAAALAPAVPVGAQVAGKLLLGSYHIAPVAPTAAQPQGFYWELDNGFKEVRPDRLDARRELAVVLLGPGDAPNQARVEVALSGGALAPATIVVRAGATLLVRNEDDIAHELFATGLQGFAAEAISPRGRRTVSLKSPGVWPLYDRLLAHLSGTLHVLPDLVATATPDADGQFSFTNVAPGTYTLKVFHREKELASQSVDVGSRPLSVDPIALTAK